MTGADHCADRFFALLRIALSCSKWADPPSLRETERRLDGMRIRMFARGISVLFPDLRRTQSLLNTPLAITAAGQRLRFRECIGGVIDIAEV